MHASIPVENKTTWDTNQLLAFVMEAHRIGLGPTEISRVEFGIYRLNPKRRKQMLRYEERLPIASAKCRAASLLVKLPSPCQFVNKTALGKLAGAASDRLEMPEAARRKVFLAICMSFSGSYDWVDDTASKRVENACFRAELPPITTKATGVRATPKRSIEDWKDRAREINYKRRDAEKRLERLENRIERLRKLEDKLDARVEKLEKRQEEREAKRLAKQQAKQSKLCDQLDAELERLKQERSSDGVDGQEAG